MEIDIKFLNRLKKELTEGVIRAVLHDAGYRLIDCGIENVVREVTCLDALEYSGLDFPKAMRSLPDFIVMDRKQKEKYLVEVKYRAEWSNKIFDEIQDQVKLFNEVVLVFFKSSPEKAKDMEPSPAAYIRCCRVRWYDDEIQIYASQGKGASRAWRPRSEFNSKSWEWWGMETLQSMFPLLENSKDEGTLLTAIESLKGILNRD